MVSIKTLKLLLTIKLRNYYLSHDLPLKSLQKNKTNNKNTKIEKSKIDGFLGFHQKKQKNKWTTKKLQKAEPVWLATDWVVSTAPLSVLDLAQPLWKMEKGQKYLFLKIAVYGKILRTKRKLMRQKKSWEAARQKGLKKQK